MSCANSPIDLLNWNILKDIDALTLTECHDTLLFLKYAHFKEVNFSVRDKYQSYMGKLTNRLIALKEEQ